jgi:signal transduction histidine kinase
MKSKQKIIIQTRQSEQKNVEIIIADTGQGIPRNQIDKIFDPFFTTKLNGMGMGLCIARSIVEMHGGRISAVSDPSSGTRFHVFLPVNC